MRTPFRRPSSRALGIALSVGSLLVPSPGAAEISIALDANLNFGQVVASGSSGSVTITTSGARSASGGVSLASAVSVSAAVFTVSGTPHTSYLITLPSSATISGGGSSMTVDSFVSSPSGTGLIGSVGSEMLRVGATLHVGAGQSQSAYSGTFTVTVAYE